MMNTVNGGAHADNNVDIQEFMILPLSAPSFREALRYGVAVFHALKAVLQSKGMRTLVGDEGGFAPDLPSKEAALDTILQAIGKAGYVAGKDIYLGLDAASSELYKDGRYELASEAKSFGSEQFVDYLSRWVDQYPIISIEDGLAEDDCDGWALLTQRLGKKVQLVGDDLFVTNTAIFQRGIDRGIASSILIKPKPDRDLDDRDGGARRLFGGSFAPLRRNRRCNDRRSGRGHQRHADQDRLVVPLGPRSQIQSLAADRSGTRVCGCLRRARCIFRTYQVTGGTRVRYSPTGVPSLRDGIRFDIVERGSCQ